jgi:hypothetical protein
VGVNYVDVLASEIELNLAADDRPEHRAKELYRLYALLALVKGEEVSLSDVHQAWSVWMAAEDPKHPALVPFEDLDHRQQQKDSPYADAIHRVASSRRRNKQL